ncbi:MAG: ATP-binding protein, partial [Gaiellaceae bacterium]
EDSVNRVLAIAAVHEILTERNEDDVELADLIERLRRRIVQGVGAGKSVETRLEQVSLSGQQATALALVFTELLQNAFEHGGDAVAIELERRDGEVVLTVSDDGPGMHEGDAQGTGLSIVQALVRDELHGNLSLESRGGLHAEVVFPA